MDINSDKQKEALNFLNKNYLGIVSTLSELDNIQSFAVFYEITKGFEFSFITKKATKKYENLLKSKKASIVVASPEDGMSCEAQAKAEILEDVKNITEVVNSILYKIRETYIKSWGPPPFAKIKAGELVVIKLVPTWLRMCDFKKTMPKDNKEIFTQII